MLAVAVDGVHRGSGRDPDERRQLTNADRMSSWKGNPRKEAHSYGKERKEKGRERGGARATRQQVRQLCMSIIQRPFAAASAVYVRRRHWLVPSLAGALYAR